MKLAELLAYKGSKAVTVTSGVSVAEAIRAMHVNRVGSVIIADADGLPAGIFTERDVMRLCAEGKGGALDDLNIADCMTHDVVVAGPDDRVDDILNLMTERRFRRMPVVQDNRLIGLVTIGDLVKARLQEATVEAQALREYISS